MGKRIGMARIEALLENLKRDINLGSSSFSGMTGGITTTGDLDVGHIKSHMVRPTYTAVTTVSADGALVIQERLEVRTMHKVLDRIRYPPLLRAARYGGVYAQGSKDEGAIRI